MDIKLYDGRPADAAGRLERERAVYDLLDRLHIPFQRTDHEAAATMEACREIDQVLDTMVCKNLFLCNRQETRFFLLMIPGDKPFKTKDLSKQIGMSRLSFASPAYMEEFLHISPGAVSVMGLMNDVNNQVQLLIDREVLSGETLGCHPCVCTSSMKMKTSDLLKVFLPAVHHEPVFVDLPRYESTDAS